MKEPVFANQDKIFKPGTKYSRLLNKFPMGSYIMTSVNDFKNFKVVGYNAMTETINIASSLGGIYNLMNYEEDEIILIDEDLRETFNQKTKENVTTPSKVLIEFITKYNKSK